MTRKLSLLVRKGLFKIEKMYVKASTIEKPLEKGRKIVRNANAKMVRVAASVALATAVVPSLALAEETKEEATENNETPIEMDAEANEVEVSTNTPIEVSADVEVIDETNAVTFASETVTETEETLIQSENDATTSMSLENIELNEGDVVLETVTPGVTITNVTVGGEKTEISADEEMTVVEDEETDSKVIVLQNNNSNETTDTSVTKTETEETVEETKYLDVETIIPGKNVSENENETKVVIPADSTYVVFTTEDGKQVIWNAESLGNPNQDKFINSYNGIADEKNGESYVFNDEDGNIVYAEYAKDENGNLIINEDRTVQIIEQVIGTMTIDEATGEKVFVGNGNINVYYGVNTPKEVLDPEADSDKPVEPTPVPEKTPDSEPDPEPTPEPTPEPEPKPETGTLVKTGDNRAMVITGLGALVLASGLLLPLTANVSRKNTKRLILK